MIKEIIVVEGRDDITAVKAAVECEVIATHGYGYGEALISALKTAAKNRGLIILTDPDYVGKRIRRDIAAKIPDCKHAFIDQSQATKNSNIGVENASPEVIKEAIMKARPNIIDGEEKFLQSEMQEHCLIGGAISSQRRAEMCKLLKIGHCNGKQFLKRLNNFGIDREEFIKALKKVDEKYGR